MTGKRMAVACSTSVRRSPPGSHLDARDAGVDGGVMDRYTVNLQWYLSRFTFLTIHVGYADLDRAGIDSGTWLGLVRWGILTH